MVCSFCGDPAAHPATGSVLGTRTIACASCARSFAEWAKRHMNGKAKRHYAGVSFYEAAAKFMDVDRRST